MKNRQLHHVLSFWKNHSKKSINRQILSTTAIVTGMTILVKIVSVSKEFVVAWSFGTGDAVDALVIALLLPMFITSVAAHSFRQAFIPVYIRVREQEGKQYAQGLLSSSLPYVVGILSLITIIMVLFARLYLPEIATGFSPNKIELTYRLLLRTSPLIILNGIVTIWQAVLNAEERFAIAALLPILIPALGIVLVLKTSFLGINALIIGMLVGTLLQAIFLGVSLHQKGISLVPKFNNLDSNLKEIFKLYGASATAAFLMGSTKIVDQSMAAMLAPGSVAALSYGYKLTALPLNLATIGLGTAVTPYFSKMTTSEDWQGIRNTLKSYLRLIFIVTIPLALTIFIFSVPIVEILLQRGEFTAKDTNLVAQIQSLYTLQLPFYVANIFIVRLITSMRMNHVLIWISALNLFTNITFNFLFTPLIGAAGIALSTSLVYLICFLASLTFIYQRIQKAHQQ